ncbi:MAG: hypothetical protein M3Z66_22610 [Chloroflexota bacterium]|nr:hypothetical protein [Chloroflexota bacterium]
MSRLLFAVLLLLIPTFMGSTPVLAIRAPMFLTSIQMMNARVGWGVSNRFVFRTVDGGQNWLGVMPCGIPRQHQLATFFLSSDDAWIAVTAASGAKIVSSKPSPVTIFRTIDGGRTWQSFRVPVQGSVEPFGRLTFANRHDGWLWLNEGVAAGNASYILLRTVDGGRQWTRTAVSQPFRRSAGAFPGCDCARAITFHDGAAGWATGSTLGPPAPFLWMTRNGGYRWRHQSFRLPRGYNFYQTYAPVFFDRREGILPVQLVRGRSIDVFDAYLTHDGGLSWTSTAPLVLPEPAQRVPQPAFSFADRSHGWISSGWDLYRTTDAGSHWVKLHPKDPFHAVAQLDFVGPKVGFAVIQFINGYEPPYFFKTIDGGQTWRVVSTYSLSRARRCV